MGVTYGFFNSDNGDRKYSATDMSKLFDGIINDGVYDSIGDKLMVKPNSGMRVAVGTGRAWFDHTWTFNDAKFPITIDAAEQVLSRIDAIVLEVNSTDTVRANSFKMVKGTPASSPVKPMLASSDTVKQHALAYITVKPAVTEITQKDIENAVGTDETPFVTGIIEHAKASDMINQWKAEFDSLFEEMEAAISQATSATLIDGSVTTAKLANKAVTSEKIADGGVTGTKLASGAPNTAMAGTRFKLVEGVHYGSTLPTNLSEGELFFKI